MIAVWAPVNEYNSPFKPCKADRQPGPAYVVRMAVCSKGQPLKTQNFSEDGQSLVWVNLRSSERRIL